MSQKLTVIEKFYPKKDCLKEVKDILISNAPLTKNEIGCLVYKLMINHEEPEELLIVEDWETMDDYKRHLKSKHVIDATQKINRLTKKEIKKEFYQLIKS